MPSFRYDVVEDGGPTPTGHVDEFNDDVSGASDREWNRQES